MLAGSQLSSIGELDPDDDRARLFIAVIAALVAVLAVAYVVYQLTEVQMPNATTLGDVRASAAKDDPP
jgi:hypothetical protein